MINMKMNRNLITRQNKFFPSTSSQIYLIRILYERLDNLNDKNELYITFREIRELFGTDIRQKFINGLLDNILVSTFEYDGKEYKYLENYVNHFEDRYYTFTFPIVTVALWLENAIGYDFNMLKALKSNKASLVLYEYFKTKTTTLSFSKFYDIFNKDGYDFYEKKREFFKSIALINEKTDLNVDVDFSKDTNSFIISYH